MPWKRGGGGGVLTRRLKGAGRKKILLARSPNALDQFMAFPRCPRLGGPRQDVVLLALLFVSVFVSVEILSEYIWIIQELLCPCNISHCDSCGHAIRVLALDYPNNRIKSLKPL